MKTASLVLGIIGGFGVLSGLILYAMGGIAEAGGWGAVSGTKLLMAGLMTAGLTAATWVGTGMVAGKIKSKPVIGIVLMAVGALGLVSVVGLKLLSSLTVVSLGLSAFLGIRALRKGVGQAVRPA
ncbi:MAG: hypothetical protein KGZ35_05375 [Truepera sp.]|nr:hypothetical protein [Truepera sp.]